jgi:hypothetical protein
MTSKFIFIGSRAEVLDTPHVFRAYGQEVDLNPSEVEAFILHQRIPLLPQDLFAATKDAKDPQLAAREALREYRQKLASPPATPAIETHQEPSDERI